MARTLYLVRHGPTNFNSGEGEEPRYRAWMDVPLNADGVIKASKVSAKLADENIERIYSSDLSRAKETARIIGLPHQIEPEGRQDLRPWNLGKYSGKTIKEAEPEVKQYFENPQEPIPEGESYNAFYTRARGAVLGILQELDSQPGADIVAVTHSRLFGALKTMLTEGREAPELKHPLQPGGMLAITVGNGRFQLKEGD